MSKRFKISEDILDDCITVTDTKEELQTAFDSNIVLYPIEDAVAVVEELNVQCAVVEMLKEHLAMYESEEDIQYWIDEVKEELE